MKRQVPFWGAVFLFLVHANSASAENACDADAGRFVSVQGSVEVLAAAGGAWRAGSLQDRLCEGDSIRVGKRSRAAVALINDAVLRIDENTTMRLVDVTDRDEEKSWLDIIEGAIMSFSRKPKLLEVSTPYLNGSIEGTEFAFRVGDEESQLTVFEGTVVASNDQGSLPVSGGESAVAAKGQPPQPRTLVRPRDAVQWSLYYPPIVATGDAAQTSASLQEAADLLSVGRVDQARASVDSAIASNADAGLAYALRSVIKVTQNERAEALADAERAVGLTDAAAASIALSYAQQADFRIEPARGTMRAAVEQHPDDALSWARLAELELMLGNRGEALAAAQKAASLAPDLSRTELVLGFNALASFRNDEAKAAFERAIQLDSADPLAHLGLGLARISDGDLAEGRRDLEAAVALDSSNALMRAYLGKAYFEERRYPLDGQQYGIAKELDPLDPTAYLYGGILKQTVNRPVEAVEDLEKSVELNDNRAVYRSRLLLDKDRAARGTSLARAYSDLGFPQLGFIEATKSLAIDPANASAHRFLSDSYAGIPRSEISRVSDLFQSQLLQDININPVQPSVSSTNLNIISQGGPGQAGFNEFTPLFERNRLQFNASGLAGSNDTTGLEGVVSGLYNRYSLSAGGFTYDTDGFRENGDLSHDIYNVYAQAAISEVFNIQAEYGHRETDRGDIAMQFDPDDFNPTFRRSLDADTWRLGVRVTPNVNSNLLLSVINADREIEGTETDELFFIPELGRFDLTTDSESNDNTYQYDAQYLYQGEGFNAIAGGSYVDVDRQDTLVFVIKTPFGDEPPVVVDNDFTIRDKRAYAYGNFNLGPRMMWTVGLSYQDHAAGELFDFDEVSPKVGVQWSVTDSLLLRGAYFQGVKPVLSSNRTLEPTQVAGFTQFFDDANATKFERYGIGADWKISQAIAVGAEATRRTLESPVISANTGEGIFEDRDEWTHRVYGYWAPADRWSVSAEFVYDKFENRDGSELAFEVPKSVRTVSFPLVARYFHPSGFFASVGATYVDQEVRGEDVYQHETGDSGFAVVDLGVGYRLPRRRGVVSLAVQNVFDEDFDYLDNSYRTFEDEPAIGPHTPERTILGKITLNF